MTDNKSPTLTSSEVQLVTMVAALVTLLGAIYYLK